MIELESPCIHRVHKKKADVPTSYHTLGMTIELDRLLNRLEFLHKTNLTNETTSYVTFDDGWRDVLLIPEDFFQQLPSLHPVVFLTDDQFKERPKWMPLHILYAWMDEKKYTLEQLPKLGIDRGAIKDWGVDDQHTILLKNQINIDKRPDYLSRQDLETLRARGWKIGSHGPEHSDLRTMPLERLRSKLEDSLNLLLDLDAESWLSWPEGRWNDEVANLAHEVGFTKQFGLKEEPRKGNSLLVEMRTLW